MKVLFIHNTIPNYRIPFFCGLSQRIDVTYIFTKMELNKSIYGNEIDYDNFKDIKYYSLPKGLKKYKLIFKYLKEIDYDFVIIPPMDGFEEWIQSVLIFIIAKIKKKKILYFWEKWEAPKNRTPFKKKVKNYIQKILCKPIIKGVDMCIASGSKSREYFMSCGVKSEKIIIAYDASGINKFISDINIRDRYGINNESKIILYYGRIIQRKGLDILIKAYSKIIMQKQDVYLLICGDGEFKSNCKKLSKKLNLEKVIFTGYINPNDRNIYFSQCDVFVLPSYFYNGIVEAWGLTVNEAMQFGKPVIATTAVGSAYDLINEKNGRIIKENSENDLYNALLEVLFEADDKKMSEAAYNTFKNFGYNNMINGFIKALESISYSN